MSRSFFTPAVISPVNFTKLAPTAISLRAPAYRPPSATLAGVLPFYIYIFFFVRFRLPRRAPDVFLSRAPAIYLADRSSESWP